VLSGLQRCEVVVSRVARLQVGVREGRALWNRKSVHTAATLLVAVSASFL
jgi:hypothetical protein